MVSLANTQDHNSYLKTRYFPALDGLRCISILAVIAFHACGNQNRIAAKGNLGVWLFFAISGFLITTLLLREQAANGKISLRKFYMRRTLRIFPLYYAVLALYVLLTLALQRHTEPGRQFFHHLPFFGTYTSNWFVALADNQHITFYFAWSLATEEQFYLIWPSVVYFSQRWYWPLTFILFMIGLKLLTGYAMSRGWVQIQWLSVRIIWSIAFPICIGCVMAYILHARRGFAIMNKILGWLGADLLLFAAVMATCAYLNEGLLLSMLMVALVAAVCIRPGNLFAQVMSLGAVRYIGQISYGMYLLHMLCMQVARAMATKAHLNMMLMVVLELSLTILVASLSYWTFERWFLKLKEQFSARPSRKSRVAIIAEPIIDEEK